MSNQVSLTKLLDDFDIFEPDNSRKKIEIPYDIVTLAVLANRVSGYDLLPNKFNRAEWEEFVSHLTDEDREHAEKIKTFYKQKLTAVILKDDYFSEYRKKLLNLLTKQDRAYTRNDAAIAFRLPEFYEYDTALIEQVFNENLMTLAISNQSKRNRFYDVKKLTFISKLHRKTKHRNVNHYWFRDEENNRVLLEVHVDNNLTNLFESHIQKGPITVSGYYTTRDFSITQPFYSAISWEIQTESPSL